ncbi:MAG: tetratricopeptide repeat protein [Vicinamibacteria bacterium]
MASRLEAMTLICAAFLFCSLSIGAPPAAAHGPIDEQIALLTKRIQEDPQDATLYLRRGELNGLHEDWDAAWSDFDKATELSPDLTAVDLARGKTLLHARQFRRAQEALDLFLARHPEHPDALLTRARVLLELGGAAASARDYGRAIAGLEKLEQSKPEYYLEWTRAFTEVGDSEHALRALDQGIAILGPIVSLQLPAIDLELTRGQYDAALARLETVSAQSPRVEPWLVRRGEILEQAGRSTEALCAYEEALAGLEPLTTGRMAELESKVRASIARLRLHFADECKP